MHMFVPYYVELMIYAVTVSVSFAATYIGYFTFDIDAIRSSLGKKKKKTPTKALRTNANRLNSEFLQ